MKIYEKLLSGYENNKLVHYSQLLDKEFPTVEYERLEKTGMQGVLKANQYVGGKLMQTYSTKENHVGVVAATRLGKTTSYVIPTVLSFAKQRIKRSMIISDPKGEIYRYTAETLKEAGYKVKLLNFRDYMHSECWNMLTPIFRKYKKASGIEKEVELVMDGEEVKNCFRGKVYDDQSELDGDVAREKEIAMEDVGNEIDNIAQLFIVTQKDNDPYWEDSARDMLRAFLWAMLEDSGEDNENPITENTYSLSTVLRILARFRDDSGTYYDDDGYFSDRPKDSRAYVLAKNSFLENAPTTRKCIVSAFNTKMSVFREAAMRLITSCNSFELDELTDGPTAVFIDYRDELKIHYAVISLFVKNAYMKLIERADGSESGTLDSPFYFILDEFGNFPKMNDFDVTISACAGRNIFFILIIQSYAQLNNVYGAEVAEIIRDNLNMRVFFGSNNPATLDMFSKECGDYTRISPLSALSGNGKEIEHYINETIPLVPKSVLSSLAEGECIVREANCGYVLFSKLERYYKCKEFNGLKRASVYEYKCAVDPFDKRYVYDYRGGEKKLSRF